MKHFPLFLSAVVYMLSSNWVFAEISSEQKTNRMVREHKLKSNYDSFYLRLDYCGDEDKPFYRATLHVAEEGFKTDNRFVRDVLIDKDQAAKILRFLIKDDFLERAAETADGKQFRTKKQGYLLYAGCDGLRLVEHIGWDLKMILKLEALKAQLGGDARSAVGNIITRLSGWRRIWEQAEARKADSE